MFMITVDMNAKVGSLNSNCESAMGQHRCSEIKDNGERLVDICLNNICFIDGTVFPHKSIHKLTWRSPDGKTVNQIVYFVVIRKWRRSLQDVRAYHLADVNSDYYLILATIKLKLRTAALQGQRRKHIDVA